MELNLENLKTELTYSIKENSDCEVLYNTYFTVTSSPLKTSIKELFELRGLKSETDFNYFLNSVLYDPDSKRWMSESLKILDDIKSGSMFDQDFLEKSKDKKVNLRDLVDDRFSTSALSKLVNYIPTGWAGGSIGRGEFAFIILGDGCKKAEKGGDLNINGMDIEVKSNEAKLASSSSHNSFQSISSQLKQFIYKHTGKELNTLETINELKIKEFYEPLFNSGILLAAFINYAFRLTMPHYEEDKFNWIFDCVIDGKFSWPDFRKQIAIFEFDYYKFCDKFDRILFINKENLNMMNVDEMSIDKMDQFRLLSPQYRFNTERIITTYWSIR